MPLIKKLLYICKNKNLYQSKSKMAEFVGAYGPYARNIYPERKPIRAEFHNYSGGDYFITICTCDKEHYFGKIMNDEMQYTPVGEYCKLQLEEINQHYPYADIPLFVIMPNHLHAIIRIDPELANNRMHEPCIPTKRTLLSIVVGGLKREITMFARRNDIEFGWQKRYHDHIIRGVYDGNRIAEYIENNVAN